VFAREFAPKGSLCGTLQINGLHYRKPTTPMPGTHNGFVLTGSSFLLNFIVVRPAAQTTDR